LRQALRGRFGDHHGLLVGLALGHLEHLEGAIAAPDGRVDEVIAPFARARDRLATITGVGKRAAETIIAEIGVDMAVSCDRWASGVVGGALPGQQPHRGQAPLRQAPGATAGWPRCWPSAPGPRPAAATPTWPPSCWRLARRIGKQKAAIAVGHSILVIAWHLLTNGCDDQDLGGDFFVRRDTDRQRQRAVAQLQALGYRVTLEPRAA
jgi:transposase